MSEIDPELQALAGRVYDTARSGDAESLATYLDAGVPVNLTNGEGNTLVMLAAYHGHSRAVELLIDRGADVDRLNDKNQSPLAGALFKGEDEVVGLLLRGGADASIGSPSAQEAARMFGREDLLGLPERKPE